MLKNKPFWIVIVILVIVSFWFMIKNREEAMEMASPSPTPTPTPVPRVQTPPRTGTAQQTKVYSELVKEYNGRRIQFDVNCQAVPTETTFKNGTSVMFDNRSGDARTFKVGATSFTLAGYGYRIMTLTSGTLPVTFSLSCGSAINVGKILLQK